MEELLNQEIHTTRPEMISSASANIVEQSCSMSELYRPTLASTVSEVEQVKCECCGLPEDCTPSYIANVRSLYCGRWVCGLCAEAVKEEYGKSGCNTKNSMQEALEAHMSMCMQFNKPEKQASPVVDLAAAMRRLMRRSMDGNSSPRSVPSSPRRGPLSRSTSCLPSFNRG